MKIVFTASFRWGEQGRWKPIYEEEQLNEIFLYFLPSNLEIVALKENSTSAGKLYTVTLETDKLFSLKELREELAKRGVLTSRFSNIKRSFSKKELKVIQKEVCFKEVFSHSGENEA